MQRRLKSLEASSVSQERPRSPEHVYERIRQEAKESIRESLREGNEPLYRIAENGDVETADGRPIDHYGDFIRALDEYIAKLNSEIVELEAQETEEETEERSE
jgi:hypothetical protein